MATGHLIFLDTFPLSAVTTRQGDRSSAATVACRQWLRDCNAAGHRLLVPAVSYYEVLRELERLHAVAKIARLKAFCHAEPDRYVSLTDEHLEQAAKYWALARNTGQPTASDDSLDGDMILVGQVIAFVAAKGSSVSDYVVATSNTKHLSRFVNASEWQAVIL